MLLLLNLRIAVEYEINFIGEVTEFDYKGTYTDSICIIDASEGYKEGTNQLKTYNINVDSYQPLKMVDFSQHGKL